MKAIPRALILAPAAALFLLGPALAHRIDIDARRIPGGKVRVEVFFADGKPARGAEIVARGPDGSEVARGVADSEGAFEFPSAPGVPLEIEAIQGGGHRAAGKVPAEAGAAALPDAVPPAGRGSTPWGKIALGVLAIAAIALLSRELLRRRRAS